ncbi:MAG: tetratricopeptide repeat protein [Clostridium sp.]|nr:tetratricopeptide repeat protein [Clostridium sp.]
MKKIANKKRPMIYVLFIGILLVILYKSIEPRVHLSVAESYLDKGNYEKSACYYDKILKAKRYLDKANIGKATCLEALGEYEKAIEYCDKLIKAKNGVHEAYNLKGRILSTLGKFEESLECYKEAFQLVPTSSPYANNMAIALGKLGKHEEAISYLYKAIDFDSHNSAAYIDMGISLQALGRASEALEYYDKAFQLSPDNAEIYYNKGLSLKHIGDFEESIICFDKALELDPLCLKSLKSKGDSLNSMGKYGEALVCFEQILEGEADDKSDTYISKCVSLHFLNRCDEASKVCDKAIEINPENPDAYVWKAKNLLVLGADTKDIRTLCNKALSIGPSLLAYDTIGLSYHYEGDYAKAISYFEKAIGEDLHFIGSHINKIQSLFQQKRYKECIDSASGIGHIFPNCQDIPLYIAECYSKLYDMPKVIKYYQKALDIAPNECDLLLRLAWAYFYLQDYDNAKEYIVKAKNISPYHRDVLSLEKELEKTKLPEAKRVSNFIEENYLYFSKINNSAEKISAFLSKPNITVDNIDEFVENIKLQNDPFTFFVHGEEYDILKEEEKMPQVEFKLMEPDICYIKINSFTPNVSQEFLEALDTIEEPNSKVLAIDLRDNPGGLIDPTMDILDYLLPQCTTGYLIYRNGNLHIYDSSVAQIQFRKVLVLVNKNSASSSEILALALKKHLDNVTIIGEPTLGKGVGQSVYEDRKKKYLLYVVSFYWNVIEENIADKGITPDVYIDTADPSLYIEELLRQARH